MQLIQNTTLQGFTVPFETPEGIQEVYIRAKSKIKVPDNYSSLIVDNLVKRRMFKVSKIVETVASQATKVTKVTK